MKCASLHLVAASRKSGLLPVFSLDTDCDLLLSSKETHFPLFYKVFPLLSL
jgi:hypothetical protein